MDSPIPKILPMRLIRRQQRLIVIAVGIYAALWAADRPVLLSSTLAYTLTLGNLIVLMQGQLGSLYSHKRRLYSWAIYTALCLVVAVLGVVVVNL